MEENFTNCMIGIGNRIREFRLNKGMSQKQFADLAKTTQSQVSMCEHGIIKMQVVTLEKFAKALGIDIMDFFESLLEEVE